MREVSVIIDLQFGSTGKGLIAGVLANRERVDTLVTAWAANAGHTFIDSGGRRYVHTMLANGVVAPTVQRVLIGPGSVIDPVNLQRELEDCKDLLQHADVLIHPHAAIITQEHRDREAGPMTAIGSTKKGCGEAMIDRIRRKTNGSNVAQFMMPPALDPLVCTVEEYMNALDQSHRVQVEGAQGYSLSMYHGFYPYTTSRDVSTAQILADCGIPAHWLTRVIGTMRTYPIRVANRYDKDGNQIGWSGPWYADQHELSWHDIEREPELTTVTKLPRRIATFSWQQLRQAVWQTGARELFVNFVNYLPTRGHITEFVNKVNAVVGAQHGTLAPSVRWLGDGPSELDVHTLPDFPVLTRDIAALGVRSREEEQQHAA